MKYNYNNTIGAFERKDRRGKKYWVKDYEAQRIINLHELGNSVGEIANKINFMSSKVTFNTVESFIKQYYNGNIDIPENISCPDAVMEDLTVEVRINRLESRVKVLEDMLNNSNDDVMVKEGLMDKVKSWIR